MSAFTDKIFRPFFHPDAQLAFTDGGETITATLPNGSQITLGMKDMKWKGSPTEPLKMVLPLLKQGETNGSDDGDRDPV
ncbi:hypothetical protein ABID82_005044 [Methylobacterium sp. PvP062]|uniref:Uncharacterized protein n=1 Tax=Methylobacterium radiotolerans TaxID=31998 RepID=A0ABV2NU25_9HYPH|nr:MULTISPECIES: hypothetical protein [unclassified Methylobacterium]MBP2498358.1 hypothetical protein [Methylobacterium sp. PvP105]MBP2505742.1 hypothetical protein [Methylobacterium sp. PvP109]